MTDQAESEPIPVHYTFGNHMHWVDMEWLWGYDALPGSTRDMLRYCDVTGARGNVNYDTIGYEKLAVEAPDVFSNMREAIHEGVVEVVGATYAQPYGGFNGGESAVRQHTYGVRRITHLLGKRPRTFWEEEFHFFPQLPQMLLGVGMEYASLFVPWTWETPVFPTEDTPVIWWEGVDGSRILTGTHHPLSLHQWPEEFADLLAGDLDDAAKDLGIVQWLELMPSPDWMCRSELMIPPLLELMDRPDLDIRMGTMSEMLEAKRDQAVVRRYSMDDVFHGMSLGKNGDAMRRRSRRGETTLLDAETLGGVYGLFGRPYPGWDVYPGWELEEAWRELLTAQHHDIHASEALCAPIGIRAFERSLALAQEVRDRTLTALAKRTSGSEGRLVVFNPLAWERDAVVIDPGSDVSYQVRNVPAFGYVTVDADIFDTTEPIEVVEGSGAVGLRRGDLSVSVDRASGLITDLISTDFPDGVVHPSHPLAGVFMTKAGREVRFDHVVVEPATEGSVPSIEIRREDADGTVIRVMVSLAPEIDAVDIRFVCEELPQPDGGMNDALQTTLATRVDDPTLVHDHPYGVSQIRAEGTYQKKYPTGDWMNSPQYFENVVNPFTALSLLDMGDASRGVLFVHDGSQQMRRDGSAVHSILSMRDPWDGDYWVDEVESRWRVIPHGPATNAERWRLAQEFLRPVLVVEATGSSGDLPTSFGTISCDAPGVAVTALFRDGGEQSNAILDNYAGSSIPNPYVVRLVEFNGEPTEMHLDISSRVAAAYRTNLLGEIENEVDEIEHSEGAGTSRLNLDVRPYEIATLYLDLIEGRKVPRHVKVDRPDWVLAHPSED